jgi:hypothetical protein
MSSFRTASYCADPVRVIACLFMLLQITRGTRHGRPTHMATSGRSGHHSQDPICQFLDVSVREGLGSSITLQTLPKSQSLSGSRGHLRDGWGRFKEYAARVTTLEIPRTNRACRVLPSYPLAWISVEIIELLRMESQQGSFGLDFVG